MATKGRDGKLNVLPKGYHDIDGAWLGVWIPARDGWANPNGLANAPPSGRRGRIRLLVAVVRAE